MARKVLDTKPIPTADARRLLEKTKQDELGEFQRRTLDYTMKFSKIGATKAEKLVRELSDKFQLDRKDAIQIANTMPNTIEELRTILAVKGRVIGTSQLEEILKFTRSYREE